MKNISTLLSILALILVGILYYIHFAEKPSAKVHGKVADSTATRDFRIAYFHLDSLENNFGYFKELSNEMKAEENQMAGELKSLESSYQRKIREWQQKGPNMTQAEGESAQREFNKMQQDYQARQMDMEKKLQSKKVDLLTDIRKKVEDFLQEYNKDKGFAYIISYEPGIMHYKDSIYDITRDVLTGLNQKYKAKAKD